MSCDEKIEHRVTQKFQSIEGKKNVRSTCGMNSLPFVAVGQTIGETRRMSECSNQIGFRLELIANDLFDLEETLFLVKLLER